MSKKPLTIKKLKEFIDEVNSRCNSIDEACDTRRNCGGCGFMAMYLFEVLSNYAKCHIRIIGDGADEVPDVGDFLETNMGSSLQDLSDEGFCLDHVILEVKVGRNTFFVDSSDCFTRKELKQRHSAPLKGKVSIEALAELCEQSDGWNDYFNRDIVAAYKTVIDIAMHRSGLYWCQEV